MGRQRLAAWLSICVAGCLAVACERSGPAPVIDRAGPGVPLATSAPWHNTPAWRVVDTLVVEIGVADGDPAYQLFRVLDGVRAPDGRILVLNSGTSEIRVYEEDGTYSHRLGGEGRGPGELYGPYRLHLQGDTVTVVDLPTDLERYLLDGEHLGRSDLDPTGVRSRLVEDRLSDVLPLPLPDGTRLVFAQGRPNGPPPLGELLPYPAVFVRAAAGGGLDTLATFAYTRNFAMEHQGERPLARGIFFVPASWHVSWATHRLILAEGPEPVVRVFALDTPGVTTLEWEPGDLASSAEDRRLRAAEIMDRVENSDGDAWFRSYMAKSIRQSEELGFNDRVPAVQDVLSDPTGRVWVLEYRRPTDRADHWRVFDRAGRELGRVALPKGLDVLDIETDEVLGVATDELGVERARLYRLRLPHSAGSANPGLQ